ncbi:MAG: family 78 glycoside hydrolase catalytic domain [Prolixibacteraceae bacterium]|nr:family 78 glycoside hydrolase catalytic domain [Prolixibacteraceae bacterium]
MNRLLFLILLVFPGIAALAGISPEKLTCEYLKNPQVVDVAQPRLAWVNIAGKGERGQVQTAYQIRVATSKKLLEKPDLWDSPKVSGEQNNRVIYAGKALKSRTECWWQVRVWDKNGTVSDWSEPAFWRMGIINASEWKAKWIGAPWQGEEASPKKIDPKTQLPEKLPPPAPMFRKEFRIEKKVEKAVAFVTGLGYFEFYLNAQKVGDDVLVPNQTNYGKRPELITEGIPLEDNFREYKVMYLAYDIKNQLKKGSNAVGSMLGNGFYNPAKHWAAAYGSPRFLAQIYITYSDGTEQIVVSDESWKAAESPVLMDMVYYGEHYDARNEQPGWNLPGFDDSAWKPVTVRKAPEGKLVAHTAHPDKVMERLQPLKIEKLANGNYHVDFGVEVSGWVRLSHISGPAGQKMDIKYLGTTYSGDNSYIFSGKGDESYAARFNWFVFNGVEIFNFPGELKPDQITAEVVHTYVEESAVFETSNPLLNTINKIWRRSQTDNMHGGVASDCPHRERSPYTGDGQVACVTVMHNYDARNFYHKWIQDILGAQNVSTGYVPNGAPWQPGCGGGVAWGAAMCIMPWEFYLHYGSKDMLEDNYVGMKEYIRYMQTWVNEEGIMYSQRTGKDGKVLRWFNLGDWVAPGNLPPDEMVHTFYFWRCADFTARAAKALNKADEAAKYAQLAEKTKQAFLRRFYDEKNGTYGKAGGNIFALKMGVPADQCPRVIQSLKADIQANGGHLDTGIFGTQFFFEVLSENGMHDLAYQAMTKKTQPGFGWWIEQGATTTWEQWDGSNSRNHPMFGGSLVWFYRKLAGMNADPEEPGYQHIIFRPQLVDDLSFVKYFNQTPYGEAGIFWKKENQQLTMQVTVPVGCRATVFVPLLKDNRITESGTPVSFFKDIKRVKEEGGYQVFEVNSGQYQFVSE